MGEYARREVGDHPPFHYADYQSTRLRAPRRDMVSIIETLSETSGPGPAWSALSEADADLTTNAGTGGQAIGARIIVTGRVVDERDQPVPNCLIEIWQANAAGRYAHAADTDYDAPLDPCFLGVGQCKTAPDGTYRFRTIKPGPYPWANHDNAWRPAHIHLSLLGPALATRLITQLYFPDDPLLSLDPIFNATGQGARRRLVARYDHEVTQAFDATGYRFDVVLRGPRATPESA